jgi:hypothetical protein
MWVQLVDEHRKELALRKAKQKETSNLAKSIKSYLEEGIDPRVLNPIPLYTDRQNPDDARKRAKQFHQLQSALQSAYSGLQDHANQIEADCERIPVHGNIRHNAWKAAFASQLGYCWTSLTGKQPSLSSSKSSKDFRTFVAQAFQSIGGNPAENWDRALRHILHDRPPPPDWDGFDRYEKDRWSPGTRVLTIEEWQKRQQRAQPQRDQDPREIAELMQREAPSWSS